MLIPTISINFSMSRYRVTWRACWRILRSCHDPSWRSGNPGGRRPGFCGFYGFYMVSMVLKIWILDGSMAKVVIVRSLNGSSSFLLKICGVSKFFESSYRVHIYLQ